MVGADGTLLASVGDVDAPVFIRSSAKPFQLAPFVASGRFDGYGFGTDTMAVMAASHSGEDRHVRTVMAALRMGGLNASVLHCGIHPPYDRETAARLARDGEPPTELRHNCSGKHAGMALHAKAAGWSVDDYWRPEHPIQLACRDSVAALTDTPVARMATATDGCGVVTFGIGLRGLALGYARLADPRTVADSASAEALGRIRDAMIEHPDLVGGTSGRLDTALMERAAGRLVAKAGAEGVEAVAVLSGGRGTQAWGLAVKIEDGDRARRAAAVATCAALAQMGALDDADLQSLREFAGPLVRDLPRGSVVGEVRAAFSLS
jgi:L-asparaginase II